MNMVTQFREGAEAQHMAPKEGVEGEGGERVQRHLLEFRDRWSQLKTQWVTWTCLNVAEEAMRPVAKMCCMQTIELLLGGQFGDERVNERE